MMVTITSAAATAAFIRPAFLVYLVKIPAKTTSDRIGIIEQGVCSIVVLFPTANVDVVLMRKKLDTLVH